MKRKRKVLILLGWNDPEILLALAQYASKANWHLETRHFFTETIPVGWHGDGLIVSNAQRADLRRFILRQASRQPTVLLGGNNPGIRAPQVLEDNPQAGRLVARHFLERGHKHFAWIDAYQSGQVMTDRRAGFISELEAAGRKVETIRYPAGDWSLRRRRLGHLLRGLPHPLALLALDDQLAAEVIEVCLETGLRVPEDVAIAGIGNIALACETSHVPITSVDLASRATAETAARLLDRLMRGAKPPGKPIVVPLVGLVARRSSSVLVATHPVVLRATRYIADHLAEPLDMERLAVVTGVSRRSLYNVLARELAQTPSDYLRGERMTRVRELLGQTDERISSIAAACGFGTVRTLNRIFAKSEHCTPRAWRRKYRNNTP